MVYCNNDRNATQQVLDRLDPFIRMRAHQSAAPPDREDRQQDLRTAVVERLPRHDPSKASAAGFGAMVVDRSLVSDLRRESAAKRRPPGPLQPLEQASCAQASTSWKDIDLQLDVRATLEALEPGSEQRAFADAYLAHGSIIGAAGALGIGLGTARRQRDKLRQHFADAGLEAYLQ